MIKIYVLNFLLNVKRIEKKFKITKNLQIMKWILFFFIINQEEKPNTRHWMNGVMIKKKFSLPSFFFFPFKIVNKYHNKYNQLKTNHNTHDFIYFDRIFIHEYIQSDYLSFYTTSRWVHSSCQWIYLVLFFLSFSIKAYLAIILTVHKR